MDENDLPLLSNIEEVRARHYLLQLQSDLASHVIHGEVIIFFEVLTDCERGGELCTEKCFCTSGTREMEKPFPVVLECNNLTIKSVSEIRPGDNQDVIDYLSNKNVRNKCEDFKNWISNSKTPLAYTQDEWSIKIRNEEPFHAADFPLVVCIEYSTNPEGDSVYWRNCGEVDVCCFTSGSFLNNRSLIPSQDRPFAMATWQAWIIVPEEFYVAMTGDDEPYIVKTPASNFEAFSSINNVNCYYYYTTMVLPMATIAIAVGKWKREVVLSLEEALEFNNDCNSLSSKNYRSEDTCNHVIYPCHAKRRPDQIGPLIPVTVVSPEIHLPKTRHLLKFVKFILIASFRLLGIHPFRRLEIVILPRCFPHLGFASPSLVFLSKCVLVDDSLFYIRLAHEISHSCFGITIGPKNWEEEWLSEGFATYLEDSIFTLALEQSEIDDTCKEFVLIKEVTKKYSDFYYLRGHLRYKTLVSERENCSEELQVLSPDNLSTQYGDAAICNGLNASKSFLQVHYLKGYFLLHHLSDKVSRCSFDTFVGVAASVFHGQLISSQEFLKLFFDYFPHLKLEVNPELKIINTWLKTSEINSEIAKTFSSLKENKFISSVNEHYNYWIRYNKGLIKNDSSLSGEFNKLIAEYKFTYSDQIILLFEHLLECKKKLKHSTLKEVHCFYKINCRNVEIQHRWCELIIKFGFPNLEDISQFLIENQAIGVYLYGELIISGQKKFKKLAQHTYEYLKHELGTNSEKVISSMIYGD